MPLFRVCKAKGSRRFSRLDRLGGEAPLATLYRASRVEARPSETAMQINLTTAIIGYSNVLDICEILYHLTIYNHTPNSNSISLRLALGTIYFPIEPIYYLTHSPPFPHRKIISSQKQTCLSLRSRHQILTDTLTASVLITSKHPHLEPKPGELNLAGPKLYLVPFRLHKTPHKNPRTGSTRRNFLVRHLRLPVPLTSKHGCTGFSLPLRILLSPPFQ